MTNDESKKQNDEQTKPEASADNSLSDADLEQVAGGYGIGTRSGGGGYGGGYSDFGVWFGRRR